MGRHESVPRSGAVVQQKGLWLVAGDCWNVARNDVLEVLCWRRCLLLAESAPAEWLPLRQAEGRAKERVSRLPSAAAVQQCRCIQIAVASMGVNGVNRKRDLR